MANNIQNLKPRNLTSEEATEMGRRGGIASGEARRKAKGMKECLNYLLDLDVKNPKNIEQLRKLGIPEELMTNETLLMVSAIQKASKGDIQAMNFIRDTSGQKPIEIQEVREVPSIVDDIK